MYSSCLYICKTKSSFCIMNFEVDEYINQALKWQDIIFRLRILMLDCGLTEDFKWDQPCYTYNKKNILLIGALKKYCAVRFFKGSLLIDDEKIFVKSGDNSEWIRQVRFTTINQINEIEPKLKAYIFEAIEVEKAGLKVKPKQLSDFQIPAELKKRFKEVPGLKHAFKSLTPGRQKAYILYFSQAKQEKTRINRVERFIPRILLCKGRNDCVCGLSKRMPVCDGSHKNIQSSF